MSRYDLNDNEKKILKSITKTRECYQEVFERTGVAGKIVLYDILSTLQFFNFTKGDIESTLLKNAGLKILSHWGKLDPQNQMRLIEDIINLPVNIKENE